MPKIKLLFVIDHLGKGGAERQFLNLVNNIDGSRFESHVFIAERRGERFEELSKAIKVHGLVSCETRNRRILQTAYLLRQTILSTKPDIIQTWLEYSTFAAALALRTITHRPIFVASQRGSIEELYGYEVKLGGLKKQFLKWAYRQAAAVTINSKYIEDQLKGYGAKKVEVIYNGIDLESLGALPSKESLRRTLGLSDDIFCAIFVGSLVTPKGIEYLIQATKSLSRGKVCLLIAGDGELREAISALTAGDTKFSLLGHVPNAAEYIKASDLLVLPSLHEGLPNVILEAMAVGTPVIATNIYGIPELIEDGVNGKLVPIKDSDSITNAIEFIYDNPAIAAGYAEASRKKAQFFNIDRMVKEYEELYSELIGPDKYF